MNVTGRLFQRAASYGEFMQLIADRAEAEHPTLSMISADAALVIEWAGKLTTSTEDFNIPVEAVLAGLRMATTMQTVIKQPIMKTTELQPILQLLEIDRASIEGALVGFKAMIGLYKVSGIKA